MTDLVCKNLAKTFDRINALCDNAVGVLYALYIEMLRKRKGHESTVKTGSSSRIFVLALVALGFLAGLSAPAQTIYYVTNTVSTGAAALSPFVPNPIVLPVAQFNASGTLVEMDVQLTGTEQAEVTGENLSPFPATIYANLNGMIEATNQDFDLPVSLIYQSSASPPVFPNNTYDYGNQTVINASDSGWVYTGAMVDPSIYQGAGTWNLNVYGSGTWSLSGASSSQINVSNFTGEGDVTVIYGYSVVPEPGMVVLAGLGCLALVCRRRFQYLFRHA